MEEDLNVIKRCQTSEDFVSKIEGILKNTLTDDFWKIILPNNLLDTTSSDAPASNTYFACLIKTSANVLFSDRKVSDLFEPSIRRKKKELEKHHIFPDNFLKINKYEEYLRDQIGNKTYLEWADNIEILDEDPKIYFKEIKKHFTKKMEVYNKMLKDHCIPDDVESLTYEEFLSKRRVMMADYIRKTFESL